MLHNLFMLLYHHNLYMSIPNRWEIKRQKEKEKRAAVRPLINHHNALCMRKSKLYAL